MERSPSHFVIDFETNKNCIILCAEDYKTEQTFEFVVHHLRNDIEGLIQFLQENEKYKETHITFNGLGFDAQISQYILVNRNKLRKCTPEEFAKLIYAKAQDIIDRQSKRECQEFPESKITIPQIDLFKLNNFGNPAKMSSLKWIQYSMDWHNLKEMPIHHSKELTSLEEIDEVLGYCRNDVKSTKELMIRCKGEINLRRTLTKEYGINLMSSSEPGISKELFTMFLSEKMGVEKRELKAYRTKRDQIIIRDILLPYIKFETKPFQDLHIAFQNLIVDAQKTKGGFKYTIKNDKIITEFGLGGVHGACESGIYESSADTIIMSSDVTSFYPMLAIKNKWAPAHIHQEIFCTQYEWFFDERKKIPKADPKNYVFKIILNSTYGLSNDPHSFMYDPQYTMATVINGQLTLMMLYEMVMQAIPEAIPLLQNTDGIEMIIPKDKKEEYMRICAQWERITQLSLEHDQYKKLIVADVNNYLAINENDKYKCKGRFEFENIALHKNKSHLIIPKAIFNYFVHGTPPENTLAKNKNIFDYCAGTKIKGDWQFRSTEVIKGELKQEKLQKTIRYYISNHGCKIVKHNLTDGRQISVDAGNPMQTIFNQYVDKPWNEYDINDKYYLDCIYKEISNIVKPPKKQLSLF